MKLCSQVLLFDFFDHNFGMRGRVLCISDSSLSTNYLDLI